MKNKKIVITYIDSPAGQRDRLYTVVDGYLDPDEADEISENYFFERYNHCNEVVDYDPEIIENAVRSGYNTERC